MSDTPETNQPTITIVDLQNILRIVDVAAERGAFRGAELTSVGTVRDRVAAFLDAVAAAQAPAEGEGVEASTTEEAPVAEEAPKPAKKAANRKR